jgi:TPP-dependent pyruvate/acetoin dehydrogenase alpha subunit
MAKARKKDGVKKLRQLLLDKGVVSNVEIANIEAKCRAEVEEAVKEVRSYKKAQQPIPTYTDVDAYRFSYAD